jgi:hypothetical protein
MASKRTFWTAEQEAIVLEMFADNYTADVCKVVGRCYSSVAQKAMELGLKKSEAFRTMELTKQGNRLRVAGKKNRFGKGHQPVNKGGKMDPALYEKVKHTFFKKGHLPHNAADADGVITVRTDTKTKRVYKYIRLSLGTWLPYHQHLWETQHGKLPEGHCLWFKDGNSLNCELSNLELISRVEAMQRNTIQRFPQELQEVIRLTKKLNRTILKLEENGTKQN